MNKKFYYFATPALVVGIVAVIILVNTDRPVGNLAQNSLFNSRSADSGESITRLAANAFGNLAQNTQNSAAKTESVANEAADTRTVGSAFQGEIAPAAPATDIAVISSGSVGATTVAYGLGGGGGIGMDSKMIAPWYNFEYVYKGEALTLEEGTADVYRRLKGGSTSARSLASMVGNLDFGGLKLNKFSDLSATNLTLMENKDKGLMVTFDFMEDNIYISENWQRWTMPERDACGADEACWQRFRLNINDVPADSDMIAMSANFLSDHEIDLSHYGTPEVDNNWRLSYEATADKTNFYVPEYASVVYPLLINNEPARDQSGNLTGLRVNINLLQKGVSGINGLTPYRYEASAYNLESSADRIIKLAEMGGWSGNFFGGSPENVKVIELGTPTKSFVQIYRYTAGSNEELYVPALVFPILNPDTFGYYGQRSVIVPLVSDMLDEIEQRGNNDGGGIMPMVREIRG